MSSNDTIKLPSVILGTSSLGNLYHTIPYETKLDIVKQYIQHSRGVPVFDSAGKYGAGLALEMLGQCLDDLGVNPEDVLISNKLGWYQTELVTSEPTFEQDVWHDIKHDAVQKISYDGILDCFHQGNILLGKYNAQMVSVHDPDEYLATAKNKEDEERLYSDILDAYRALAELKAQGKVKSIGVGSKQWNVIRRITNDVALDWVMIANSLTLHNHSDGVIEFVADLDRKGVTVINAGIFNGGFLIGSDFYNYKNVDENTAEGRKLYEWREVFFALCRDFNITPARACVHYGLNIPGVASVALSAANLEHVKANIEMSTQEMPKEFWSAMQAKGLIV